MNRSELFTSLFSSANLNMHKYILHLFRFQYQNNRVYRTWCNNVGVTDQNYEKVESFSDIPFLPISAFKTQKVASGDWEEEVLFESSGTTGQVTSKKYVRSIHHYLRVTETLWNERFNPLSECCFFALLPSYLERSGSSLICMVSDFISKSSYDESDFFLYDHERLYRELKRTKELNIPTVLFGVSFALLDFAEKYALNYPNLIVMETGGMKGRRKEMTKAELHQELKNAFSGAQLCSEYGMTELCSQSYSLDGKVFNESKYLKVIIKEFTDPFQNSRLGKSGVINIIDLANIDTCAFLETQDIGRKLSNDTFEILGRLDQSDIRGCNLMVSDM